VPEFPCVPAVFAPCLAVDAVASTAPEEIVGLTVQAVFEESEYRSTTSSDSADAEGDGLPGEG
jgi:hypothetical protein